MSQLLLAALLSSTAHASPMTVTQSLRLIDATGTAVNGPTAVSVSLYDAQSGGTQLFTESFPGLPVADGYASVVLGAGATSLDSSAFRGNVWLETTVAGVAMARTALHDVPTAGNLTNGVVLQPSGARTWRDGSTAASCADYRAGNGGSYVGEVGDGVYTVKPAATAYDVVCDMSTDGGGWTLLLKATGAATLDFFSAYWTNTALLGQTDLTLAPGDSKYAAFLDLPVHTLRGCLGSAKAGCFEGPLDAPATALATFSGGQQVLATNDVAMAKAQGSWYFQANCRQLVINRSATYVVTRFGFTANNEADCATNDTALGFGTAYTAATQWNHGAGTVWQACLPCSNREGTTTTAGADLGTTGFLWGR